MYESRQFAIFSTSELEQVDFSQVLETSKDTVRTSVDGTFTFVKWDGEQIPSSIQALTTVQGYYTYTEMLEILSAPEWVSLVLVEGIEMVRARDEFGRFIPDDPNTPDINEAWTTEVN